jgi:hypothetical protein
MYEEIREMMKINLVAVIIIVVSTSAFANEKRTVINGHIITQKIMGNDMNHSEVLRNDLKFITHQFSLSLIESLSRNLPVILDGVSTQVRLEFDELYKCSLQGDYKNKECK